MCAHLDVSPCVSSEYEGVLGSLCVFLCVFQCSLQTLSVCRGSHGPSKGLSTEAIRQCVCWNNVFDLAVGQQQVLGGPAWSCCSLPALIRRPGTSPHFSVSFPPIFVFLLLLFPSSSLSSLFFLPLSLPPFAKSHFLVALLLYLLTRCVFFLLFCLCPTPHFLPSAYDSCQRA